jgi:hypothetical protein
VDLLNLYINDQNKPKQENRVIEYKEYHLNMFLVYNTNHIVLMDHYRIDLCTMQEIQLCKEQQDHWQKVRENIKNRKLILRVFGKRIKYD